MLTLPWEGEGMQVLSLRKHTVLSVLSCASLFVTTHDSPSGCHTLGEQHNLFYFFLIFKEEKNRKIKEVNNQKIATEAK